MNGVSIFEMIPCFSTSTKLIEEGKTPSEQGRMFEILNKVIIRFGCCELFPPDEYELLEGNINTNTLTRIRGVKKFLQNTTSTKSGAGDIVLRHKKTGEYTIISCKYYQDDSKKSVTNYDVQDIHSAMKDSPIKNYRIFLLVKNEQEVVKTLNNCERTNHHLRDAVSFIFGTKEMERGFQLLKKFVGNRSMDDIENEASLDKPILALRVHQEWIVYGMLQKIYSGKKHILLGAKPRSGKTYCIGGLISEFHIKKGRINVLVLTSVPTETRSQFTVDMFHKHREFNDIGIFDIKSGKDFKNIVIEKDSNIFFVSKQLMNDFVNETTVQEIKDLNLDMIISDESHFHGTTENAQDIITSYESENTAKIFVTATYNKPLLRYNISIDCRFYWDLEDEKLCKKRNIKGLIRRHGENVSLFLTEENKESCLECYDIMPELYVLTNMMHPERYDSILKEIRGTNSGFSFETLYALSKDKKSFLYGSDIDNFLLNIGGRGVNVRDKSCIYERIKTISSTHNSRTKLCNEDFSTQLWFLPCGGKGSNLNNISVLLKKRMEENRRFARYEILIVNNKQNIPDVKNLIRTTELKAKNDGKDGLIILAGNQLTLGITLPFVDIVFLMTDSKSDDLMIQKMFRCMTERILTDDSVNTGEKKFGFVVDFNIARLIRTLISLVNFNTTMNPQKKIEYIVENELIIIDGDEFKFKEGKSKLIQYLTKIWNDNHYIERPRLLLKLGAIKIDIDSYYQQLIDRYFTAISEGSSVEYTYSDVYQPLPSGRLITKVEESIEDETAEQKVSFVKDVLSYVIPLVCILTREETETDLLNLLGYIEKNDGLLKVFNVQTSIFWKGKNLIKLIKDIVLKYLKNNFEINKIIDNVKMSLQSLLDEPQKLLEYIDSCLKPKEEEKKANGEVFTPTSIIVEILDNLDKDYTAKNGRSIFTESSFKWGDIAGSGMGNFAIAVYLRLMEGLKTEFPDDERRKKHILENMIYMAELNPKNVFICRQILNFENKYKLNLYEGNALLLEPEEEWKVSEFDVILGNPPYNRGGIKSHTGKGLAKNVKNETIWPMFVKNALRLIKPKGYLCFVHPSSWLRLSSNVHQDLLKYHIVWLQLWDNSKTKTILKADIPISFYVLHKIPADKNKTEIVSIMNRRKLKTVSSAYLDKSISIPLAYHSVFEKLYKFIQKRKLSVEFKTTQVDCVGDLIPIPQNYTVDDGWAVDRFRIEDGILVRKTVEEHPDLRENKLIIANKSRFIGAFIDNGRLGLTGNHKFYILGEHLDVLERMLKWNIMRMVEQFTKYGQDYLDNEAFKYVPDIRKLENNGRDITEKQFMRMIGMTEDEMRQILDANDIEDE